MQTVEQVKQALRWATPVLSLAALVRVAIEDGRKMRPEVRPDWSAWYRARSLEGPCTACFGGAVMLGTMDGLAGLEECDVVMSSHLAILYDRDQYAALCALDRVRRGDLRAAYAALGLWHDRPGDGNNRNAFRTAVRALKLARYERTGGVTSAPAHFEFVRRDQFNDFLDDCEELAGQLAEIEAEHLAAA